MPTSHRSRSRGDVQKYHPLCLEKYLWLEYCNAISLQLKPKNWWVQILSLQVILNKKSSQRDFWHFDIYFSWICAWEFFELISQVRESVSSIIHVENPTDGDVKILPNEIVCNNEDIEIKPN